MAMTGGVALYSEQDPNYDQLIEQYAVLVKRIGHHLKGRLPSSVQVDDLIQSGMIGLMEAARKYEPSKGASFETYAGIRIRGAMLDEIRKGDWAPRSVHRNSRRIAEAIRFVEGQTGCDAKDSEVAQALDMSLEQYHHQLQDGMGSRLFSFEELLAQQGEREGGITGGGDSPLGDLQSAHFRQHLARAIATLPEREQLVLALYYDEELNLKEIGAVLEVSESRVSQIHSQAAHRLRARLSEWIEKQS